MRREYTGVEAGTDERERTEWNFAFNQESNERPVGSRRDKEKRKSGEDKAWKALNGI